MQIVLLDDLAGSSSGPNYMLTNGQSESENARSILAYAFIRDAVGFVSVRGDRASRPAVGNNDGVAAEGPADSKIRLKVRRQNIPIAGQLQVKLQLTGTSDKPLTITGDKADIAAPDGMQIENDGTLIVTIPAGERDVMVELTVVDDEEAEGVEEMTVKVLDGVDYDVVPNAPGVKRWVCENQFVSILDDNRKPWEGQAADAFAVQLAAAVGTFANQYKFAVSKRNKAANVQQLVVMEAPAAAAAAFAPDAAVEQQRVQLVAVLRNPGNNPLPGQPDAGNLPAFTDFCETQFNAINGNRGRVYSHALALEVFSKRTISIRPTPQANSLSFVDDNLLDIAWNSTLVAPGVGDPVDAIAHELVLKQA